MNKSIKRIIAIAIAIVMVISCDVAFAGSTVQNDSELSILNSVEAISTDSGKMELLDISIDLSSSYKFISSGYKASNHSYTRKAPNGEWVDVFGGGFTPSDYFPNGVNGGVGTNYLKYVAPSTGLLVVQVGSYTAERADDGQSYKLVRDASRYVGSNVKLLDSKKNSLSSGVSNFGNKTYFGVKKGKTYYIKVKGSSSISEIWPVKLKTLSVKDRAISTKSKAKTLKRKAKYTNTAFVASKSSSTDWYKINVTKKRKTAVRLDVSKMASSGTISVSAYKGKKKLGETRTYKMSLGYSSIDLELQCNSDYSNTATKGTYYIKVKKSSNASGEYRIKYVK